MFTRKDLKIPNRPAEVSGGVLEEVIARLNQIELASYEQWRELQRFLRGLNNPGALGTVTSFTPVLTFTTPGDVSVAYSTRSAEVAEFGGRALVTFDIVTSSFTHTTASGSLNITGCPVIPRASVAAGSVLWEGITKANYTQVVPVMLTGSAVISFVASGSGQAASNVAAADMPTAGTVRLRGSVLVRI